MPSIVIAGAGPGGCAAAIQCQRLGVTPVVIDATGVAGGLIGNAWSIENYPGLESPVDGTTFAARLASQMERFDLKIHREVLLSLAFQNRYWEARTDRRTLMASSIILATGTRPRHIDLINEADLRKRKRLFYEVRELLKAIPAPARVAVIGGGEASMDYAMTLSGIGARVHLFARSSLKGAQRLIDAVANTRSIRLLTHSLVLAMEPLEDGVQICYGPSETAMSASKAESFDAVLFAIGRISTMGDLLPWSLQQVNSAHSGTPGLTHAEGLFICGDARLGGLGQAGIAVGDGLAAAALATDRHKGMNR